MVILASGSARRQMLLRKMGVPHEVQPSEFDEYAVPYKGDTSRETAAAYVEAIATGKVMDVALKRSSENDIILGGDLVVFVDDMPIFKPKSFKAAQALMPRWMGRWHDEVVSVVGIRTPMEVPFPLSPDEGSSMEVPPRQASKNGSSITLTEHLRVFLPELTEKEQKAYLDIANPTDKAAGVCLTSYVSILGSRRNEIQIEGSISGVIGFPVELVASVLQTLGVGVPVEWQTVEADLKAEIFHE